MDEILISIHPMLRFIKKSDDIGCKPCVFQYIPCYGLSKEYAKSEKQINAFQYIPCYGLSPSAYADITIMVIFQYIPCYGLSSCRCGKLIPQSNFNTSHVTVYLSRPALYNYCKEDFNTSHVTVYQLPLKFRVFLWCHFNTSHVTVYRMLDRQIRSLIE